MSSSHNLARYGVRTNVQGFAFYLRRLFSRRKDTPFGSSSNPSFVRLRFYYSYLFKLFFRQQPSQVSTQTMKSIISTSVLYVALLLRDTTTARLHGGERLLQGSSGNCKLLEFTRELEFGPVIVPLTSTSPPGAPGTFQVHNPGGKMVERKAPKPIKTKV